MNVLTLKRPGTFEYSQVPAATRAEPGMALVRVHRVGICGTDLHAFGGTQPYFAYPRILGHELAVDIIALGSGETSLKIGDKCSVEPYVNCSNCIACRRGKPNCCTNMQVIGVHTDGGMREFFSVPTRKLHPANNLTLDQIALVETLAIGAHAVARAQIEKGENILVIGAGPIGLSVMQFGRTIGRVIAADITRSRLAFCKEKLGITNTLQLTPGNNAASLEQLKSLTDNDLPTVVIDATGNLASMSNALNFLAHGGRLVYVGLRQGEVVLNDPEFHRRETTLLGSRNALPEDFTRIVRAIENRELDTGPWITHRANLGEAADAFPLWCKPESGVLKAIIDL